MSCGDWVGVIVVAIIVTEAAVRVATAFKGKKQ